MAVVDATCLFSKHTRQLLVGFSVCGIVLGRWSEALLKEAEDNLVKKGRDDALEDLRAWIRLDAQFVRDGLVAGYELWSDQLSLPDPGDVHVLAAAIACGATIIVTDNLKDFRDEDLEPYGIVAMAPDEFAVKCVDANPVLAARVVTEHLDPVLFLDKLSGQLPDTVALLRDLMV